MTWEQTTRFVLVGVVIFLVLYDLAALYFGGADATISRVAYRAACDNPFLAIALGFILGHIFWPH